MAFSMGRGVCSAESPFIAAVLHRRDQRIRDLRPSRPSVKLVQQDAR